MTPPRLPDFGLSDADVRDAKRDERRIERAQGIILWAGIVAVLAAGVAWYGWEALLLFWIVIVGVGLMVAASEAMISFVILSSSARRGLRQYRRFTHADAHYRAWWERTQADFWQRLSGLQFEREVTALLNRAGMPARRTPASGDGGVDIVLEDGRIVQCKAYRGQIGPAAVRELYGVLMSGTGTRAILVSRGGFTAGARDFAAGKPIDLWDQHTLISLQRQRGQGKDWPARKGGT